MNNTLPELNTPLAPSSVDSELGSEVLEDFYSPESGVVRIEAPPQQGQGEILGAPVQPNLQDSTSPNLINMAETLTSMLPDELMEIGTPEVPAPNPADFLSSSIQLPEDKKEDVPEVHVDGPPLLQQHQDLDLDINSLFDNYPEDFSYDPGQHTPNLFLDPAEMEEIYTLFNDPIFNSGLDIPSPELNVPSPEDISIEEIPTCTQNYQCTIEDHIGLFSHNLFTEYFDDIAASMCHALCFITPDSKNYARFSCILCPNFTNMSGFDMKIHMQKSHNDLMRFPQTINGVLRNLKDLTFKRKSITAVPKKLFCGTCFQFLNSNVEHYVHFATMHNSAESASRICVECTLPFMDEGPLVHYGKKHSKICKFPKCEVYTTSPRSLLDHYYEDHFVDIYSHLDNFEAFYTLAKTNSSRCQWKPDVKVALFLKQELTNFSVPRPFSPAYYYQLSKIADLTKPYYCAITSPGSGVKLTSWVSMPQQRVMDRESKIISYLTEFLGSIHENTVKILDPYDFEVTHDKAKSTIRCFTCQDNLLTHAGTTEFCLDVNLIDSKSQLDKFVPNPTDIILGAKTNQIAGVWIAQIDGPLGRGPTSCNFPLLNLSFKHSRPSVVTRYRAGRPIMEKGVPMERFFNLQQYCERVLMHLPKDFGGPVFIEFLYSGSLLSLEEMSDYCIAFIAAVAELRNRYGHSIIILGPYPKRTLDQTKFEFESSRKELFDLTNILTMIPPLPFIIPPLPFIERGRSGDINAVRCHGVHQQYN